MIVLNPFCDDPVCAGPCWRGLCGTCGSYTAVHEPSSDAAIEASVDHICGARPRGRWELERDKALPIAWRSLRRRRLDAPFDFDSLFGGHTDDRWNVGSQEAAEVAARALYNEFHGSLIRASEVSSFLRCPEHPDGGITEDVCFHLAPFGDPCDAHDLTREGGIVVEVVSDLELFGGGWDGQVLYPQWDVELVDDDGLLCDDRPIDARFVITPWVGPPGLGLPVEAEGVA